MKNTRKSSVIPEEVDIPKRNLLRLSLGLTLGTSAILLSNGVSGKILENRSKKNKKSYSVTSRYDNFEKYSEDQKQKLEENISLVLREFLFSSQEELFAYTSNYFLRMSIKNNKLPLRISNNLSKIINGQISQESLFEKNAKSASNAIGFLQLLTQNIDKNLFKFTKDIGLSKDYEKFVIENNIYKKLDFQLEKSLSFYEEIYNHFKLKIPRDFRQKFNLSNKGYEDFLTLCMINAYNSGYSRIAYIIKYYYDEYSEINSSITPKNLYEDLVNFAVEKREKIKNYKEYLKNKDINLKNLEITKEEIDELDSLSEEEKKKLYKAFYFYGNDGESYVFKILSLNKVFGLKDFFPPNNLDEIVLNTTKDVAGILAGMYLINKSDIISRRSFLRWNFSYLTLLSLIQFGLFKTDDLDKFGEVLQEVDGEKLEKKVLSLVEDKKIKKQISEIINYQENKEKKIPDVKVEIKEEQNEPEQNLFALLYEINNALESKKLFDEIKILKKRNKILVKTKKREVLANPSDFLALPQNNHKSILYVKEIIEKHFPELLQKPLKAKV